MIIIIIIMIKLNTPFQPHVCSLIVGNTNLSFSTDYPLSKIKTWKINFYKEHLDLGIKTAFSGKEMEIMNMKHSVLTITYQENQLSFLGHREVPEDQVVQEVPAIPWVRLVQEGQHVPRDRLVRGVQEGVGLG